MLRAFIRTSGHNFLVVLGLAAVLMFGLATQDKESVSRPPVMTPTSAAAAQLPHALTNDRP